MIVFVMSTMDRCWEYSPTRLFPPAMVADLGISQISFNSIAMTIMKKAVTRMAAMIDVNVSPAYVKQVVDQAEGELI